MFKAVKCKFFNLNTIKSQLFLLVFSVTYNNKKTKLYFRIKLFDIFVDLISFFGTSSLDNFLFLFRALVCNLFLFFS